jgi:type IV pilus biogenesis protein PilP
MSSEFRRLMAVVAACGCIAHSGQASAQTTPAAQLSSLQAQIPVLKAQAEIAKLKAEIADAGKPQSTNTMQPGYPGMPMAGTAQGYGAPAFRGAHAGDADAPSWRVTEISGFNGRYTALLIDGDGRAHEVAPGFALPGGWHVAKIAPHTVVLAKGAMRRTLEF